MEFCSFLQLRPFLKDQAQELPSKAIVYPFISCGQAREPLQWSLAIGRFAALEGHTVARRTALSGQGSNNLPLRSDIPVSSQRSLSLGGKRRLECGGKRSATPLWIRHHRAKAVSPLRVATALQN